MSKTLRWGIASAGRICNDFVLALQTLPETDHRVVAVGARSLESAETFAKKHKIPKAYGSYEELCQDPDIDVIYIGSINTTHLHIAKLAFQNKKNVVSEKPLTMCTKDSKEMIRAAKEADVYLLDGIWSRFHPGYVQIRKSIAEGEIGEPLRVDVSFGVNMERQERVLKKNLGGSATLDIGVYCVNIATMVLGSNPKDVVAQGIVNDEGVDIAVSAILVYDGGKYGCLQIDTRMGMVNECVITGTKGIIKIHSIFWAPNKVDINGKLYEYEAENEGYVYTNSYFFRYEAEMVRQDILNGRKENGILTLETSIDIATIMDTMRKAAGVVTAVGARSLESAKAFADRFGIPAAYGSYKDLCEDSNVDVVYIGAINTMHLPIGLLALENGKHVICEKSMTTCASDTKKLVAKSREVGRFLLEGVWSRFHPAYELIRSALSRGEIGEVIQVDACMDVPLLSRKYSNGGIEIGGSATLDLGIYPIQFAQAVRDCIFSGLLESPLMPLEESIAIAEIMEEIRRSASE
ncbi:unnamed protein product [Cyprideis torosa]|uniref:Trans-1,2-dihydrobenzene-1,2-diol dehydrogenase n=1 Tax=Cyprideis torosa TaxID=163714 RepID=A0A7R8WH77_9CRUS|nr:unnamed protein product [Cyprideis torosa]CAG0899031.1 unnamed protein product [Cyprideis torosa]